MALELTSAMRGVIEFFEQLGPRWGLQSQSCAVHALLFLTGRKMKALEVATMLQIDETSAQAALEDLANWDVVKTSVDGLVWTDGEPWDLLFAGMEERRRREIGPAIAAIGDAAKAAGTDGTPRPTIARINSLYELLQDLSSVGDQMNYVPSGAFKTAVRLSGRVSKFLGRRKD
ncbi:MAG: hypothetical protein ABJN26_08030 [Stappiaceae bacterium]